MAIVTHKFINKLLLLSDTMNKLYMLALTALAYVTIGSTSAVAQETAKGSNQLGSIDSVVSSQTDSTGVNYLSNSTIDHSYLTYKITENHGMYFVEVFCNGPNGNGILLDEFNFYNPNAKKEEIVKWKEFHKDGTIANICLINPEAPEEENIYGSSMCDY